MLGFEGDHAREKVIVLLRLRNGSQRSRRDIRRSARTFPPVWHGGQ